MNDLSFEYRAIRQKRHGAKGCAYNLPNRVNLAGWWRYRVGITNINGACSSWNDASNNLRPLIQATASKRPTVLSDGSLLFDGVTQTLAAAFTLAQPLSFYLLFQQVAWTNAKVILDGVTATVKLGQGATTPGIIANAGSAMTQDNTIPAGVFGVACFVANGATSVYQAGGGASTVTTSGSAGANSAGGITLGSDRSGANCANIIVRECIAYSVSHDGPTRLAVLRYLASVGGSVGGV